MENTRNPTDQAVHALALQLLREAEICKLLDISHATWWRWVKVNPGLLTPIRLGRNTTRWRASAVQAFIEVRERGDADSSGAHGTTCG
jgi:predicted DNA-binding transcriptional regulator AlpA